MSTLFGEPAFNYVRIFNLIGAEGIMRSREYSSPVIRERGGSGKRRRTVFRQHLAFGPLEAPRGL